MAQANRTSEDMAAMNMTPLIDVLLVLLVMFIITIPVAAHSVEVDLPACEADCPIPAPDKVTNKLVIDASDRLIWNGDVITEGQLVELLKLVGRLPVEPELQFEPAAGASYDRSARVLSIIKASGVTKFGFVGNERYRDF